MPHVVIEYSKPLAGLVDVQAFIDVLHETLASQNAFDIKAVRTRAIACENYRMKDYGQERQFVHVLIHILEGRAEDDIRGAVQALGDAAMRVLPEDVEFSLEMREMRKDFYYKPA